MERGGFPGTVGSDPRYSRRVRDAVGATSTRDRAETKNPGRTPANYPATRSQCERPFDRAGRRSMRSCEILHTTREMWRISQRDKDNANKVIPDIISIRLDFKTLE